MRLGLIKVHTIAVIRLLGVYLASKRSRDDGQDTAVSRQISPVGFVNAAAKVALFGEAA